MPKKIEEYLHILSPTRAYLSAAKIMGPIVHPLYIAKKAVVKMLMSGAEVYEYIPSTKKTIKLSLSNINDPNRYTDNNNTKVDESDKMESTHPVDTVTKPGVPNKINTLEPEKDTNEVTDGFSITFQYNENGTVNESTIDWSLYTKDQRKEIRNLINKHNESIKNS